MSELLTELSRWHTYGMLSNLDTGGIALHKKSIQFGGTFQRVNLVNNYKSCHHETSDLMKMEKQHDILFLTLVIQFGHKKFVLNLLDIPGHGVFSEDTYRALTAVDSTLMVIESAKDAKAH
ncbi:GTP-binding protein [Nitrosomonas sp. Nm166]|uniref:GTP-binding protein n=1 Tax=Nitrosomonas sp. Nm166 TaxID=1881054 RepID=UPI0008EC702E|nr:GTP-binding protein [Nitrosomonas sp. Nm166]SFE30831.1 peptide chain release factor 3 [Nitrosomonas sp. Nm166]